MKIRYIISLENVIRFRFLEANIMCRPLLDFLMEVVVMLQKLIKKIPFFTFIEFDVNFM